MTVEDLDEVLRIERDSFPKPWTRDQFESELKNPVSTAYALKVTEGGREKLGAYIIFWVVHGEAHVLDIAVNQGMRRRGLATMLLEAALEHMQRNMVYEVFLEVRTSNRAAISLYSKFGFRESFIRKNYYGDEDAIVMTLVF
jgi:[ribosomal protein S18]-alanine N-acetyltransferase